MIGQDAKCEKCNTKSYWICWDTTQTPHPEHRFCDTHATKAEEAGWTFQQLETPEQNETRIAWSLAKIGAN